MVNIAELLKKSIEKQKLKPTSEVRQHIYEKARLAIKSKLDEMDALELVQRSYMLQLEAAICEVEAFYVLEPEFFEIKDEKVTCHFAYHAYLPDYFRTKQDIAVDPSELHTLTHEQSRLVSLKKIDQGQEDLTLEAEEGTNFNLQEKTKKSSLQDEVYPVDIDIAAETQNTIQPLISTTKQDAVGDVDDDVEDSHIEPLIEGLEEEFYELSKNIAEEARATADNNVTATNFEEVIEPSDSIENVRPTADNLDHSTENELQPEGNLTEHPQITEADQSQISQYDESGSIKGGDNDRQTSNQQETQQKGMETPDNDEIALHQPSTPHLQETPNRTSIKHAPQMRMEDYPLYIDTAANSFSAHNFFVDRQSFYGNQAIPSLVSSGLKSRQSLEQQQETVFKKETVVMAASHSFSEIDKNDSRISDQQTSNQIDEVQSSSVKQQIFNVPPEKQVMVNNADGEKQSASAGTEMSGVSTSEQIIDDADKQSRPSQEEQPKSVDAPQPVDRDEHEREPIPSSERSGLQSPELDRESEKKEKSGENNKFNVATDQFSETKFDEYEINTSLEQSSNSESEISEEIVKINTDLSNDKNNTHQKEEVDHLVFFDQTAETPNDGISDVSGNEKNVENREIEASETSDIEDNFEKKRAEFFDGLNDVQSDHAEHDLFPQISSLSAHNSTQYGKKSLRSKSWIIRSIAAGIIALSIPIGIYFFNSTNTPNVTATIKDGVSTDPSKTAAINHIASSIDGERLQRENYDTTKHTKDNKSVVGTKEPEVHQSVQSDNKQLPAENVTSEKRPDATQFNSSGRPVDGNLKDVSLPLSVIRPNATQSTPAKETMVEPQDDQKKQENTTASEQLQTTIKSEPSLLLLTDQKGKQVKIQGIASWSLLPPHERENPLDETALVAEFKTDDGKLGARMSIRKNYRQKLGATHLIDLTFSQSDSFDGGVVVDVEGIYFGNKVNVLNKQAATIIADLYENNFVASLRNDSENKEVNKEFIENSTAMGVQAMFTDGKTALFILNKGEAETKLFEDFNSKTTH